MFGPKRYPGRRNDGDRRALLVDVSDPDVERVLAMGRATLGGLLTALTTALALSEIPLVTPPVDWILTGLAAAAGTTIPAVWRWHRERAAMRLPVWQLSPAWAAPVLRAAEKADRLHRIAERAPDGPIAEHLQRLAVTADGYVVTMHRAAALADESIGEDADDGELRADVQRINVELAELVEAAERLRRAQRDHLESSPLSDLIAETERITASIEAAERAER